MSVKKRSLIFVDKVKLRDLLLKISVKVENDIDIVIIDDGFDKEASIKEEKKLLISV